MGEPRSLAAFCGEMAQMPSTPFKRRPPTCGQTRVRSRRGERLLLAANRDSRKPRLGIASAGRPPPCEVSSAE